MFDIGFSEFLVIGVVALVVIGPERLPKVARTLGVLMSRAQRYVNNVKADINREIAASEFADVKQQLTASVDSLNKDLKQFDETVQTYANDVNASILDANASMHAAVAQANDMTLPPAPAVTDNQVKPVNVDNDDGDANTSHVQKTSPPQEPNASSKST